MRNTRYALVAIALLGVAGSAHALSSFRTSFDSRYGTAGTKLSSCSLCHPGGNTGTLNGYGSDFLNAGASSAAFASIESRDSDGDGYTNIQEITARTFPGDASDRPAAASTCTSFTYSAWGTCQSNGQQTRTVTASSPTGCTGGTPVTSQSCTYVPPTCTSFTYSAWGTCQPSNTQTRTVASSSPSGCTGGTPVLSQSCTYVPPSCSYTYSAWGSCQPSNTQTRSVTASSPTGCAGTPVTSQACTYVPPTPVCVPAVEVCGDGVDQDCDGADLVCPPAATCGDADQDGFAVCDGACEPAAGATCGDCDDAKAAVNPGAVEATYGSAACSDVVDNDCDSIVDAAELACMAPPSSTGDWDIDSFRAAGSVTVGSRMYLSVRVTGTSGRATLTVYGTQNGNRIPVGTREITAAGASYFSYTPAASGTITWVAELTDADPDVDRATQSTWVFRAEYDRDGDDHEEDDHEEHDD